MINDKYIIIINKNHGPSPETSQPEEPLQSLVCLILFLTHFKITIAHVILDWPRTLGLGHFSSLFEFPEQVCACKLWFATIRTEWTGNWAGTRTGISNCEPDLGQDRREDRKDDWAGERVSCQICFLSIGPELMAELNYDSDKWQVAIIKMTGDGRWWWLIDNWWCNDSQSSAVIVYYCTDESINHEVQVSISTVN